MQYGLSLPYGGPWGDARTLAELAQPAEVPKIRGGTRFLKRSIISYLIVARHFEPQHYNK